MSKQQPFQAVVADTKSAERGVLPDRLVGEYGNKPPKAAEFGVGATNLAQVKDATDARRAVVPGTYDSKR
jgi:hypothetical protein